MILDVFTVLGGVDENFHARTIHTM
jgi:hypothetical protein